MRIAYLNCFAGIAGDMFLGALLDAGVPAEVMQDAAAALDIGASLKIETVDRSGISAQKVHVLEAGAPVEPDHSHAPGHRHTQSLHRHHAHGRSLTLIRKIIARAPLKEAVKSTAIRAFDLLGHSEAKVHNVPVESIYFHEVGAVDAIVDIVAASAGVSHLGIGAWHCSPLNVGGGMVMCAHGNFPVPAPATADLLRGLPTYSAHLEKELVTPTGAALVRALEPVFGPQPPMLVEAIGYGAGTRNPEGFPNVLRLSVGEALSGAEATVGETITVMETALDDLSPQVVAYAAEKALAAGALDVMLTPVHMKKGRSGTLLTVLCHPSDSDRLQGILFRETSTLGIRIRQDQRVALERRHIAVQTPYGAVRIKVGSAGGEYRTAAPEFEDCRAAAERHGVPLKEVQQAALSIYRGEA